MVYEDERKDPKHGIHTKSIAHEAPRVSVQNAPDQAAHKEFPTSKHSPVQG